MRRQESQGLKYALVVSMHLNGSLGTLQRGTTARLWKSLQLTCGRTLLKLLGPPKGPLTELRHRTQPPPKRMKGSSSLFRRSQAVLLLTSKRSWMCSNVRSFGYPRSTVLSSILAKLTSKEPTSIKPTFKEPPSSMPNFKKPTSSMPNSKKPTSSMPNSKNPTSKEPSSNEPTAEEPISSMLPTSKEPTSNEPNSKKPTSIKPTSK